MTQKQTRQRRTRNCRVQRAVIYTRAGSKEGQRLQKTPQVEAARRLGWQRNRILVIEEDTGKSAAAPDRAGYRRLCEMIRGREVGLVLVSEVSRLTRSPKEFAKFLALCRQAKTLLTISGAIA